MSNIKIDKIRREGGSGGKGKQGNWDRDGTKHVFEEYQNTDSTSSKGIEILKQYYRSGANERVKESRNRREE